MKLPNGNLSISRRGMSVLGPMVIAMTEPAAWPPIDVAAWQRRIRDADIVGQRWALPEGTAEEDEQAERWLASINPAPTWARATTLSPGSSWNGGPTEGSRSASTAVSRSDKTSRTSPISPSETFTRSSTRTGPRVQPSSRSWVTSRPMRSPTLTRSLTRSPDRRSSALTRSSPSSSLQRSSRRERPAVDESSSSMPSGTARRWPPATLLTMSCRRLRVTPHQNETAIVAAQSARALMPYFMCRPLAIMTLNRPALYVCDEPVVLNAPDGEFHLPDCALTDAEIEERVQRQLRKVKLRRRGRAKVRGRTVHFSSTMPTGHGVADEILLAISPGTALLWGPLTEVPQGGPVERVTLGERESTRFAEMANGAMCAQALDWIITRTDDEASVPGTSRRPGR